MAKHYDNKNDLIREMKLTQKRSANAVGATWKCHMILATDILLKNFMFSLEDMQKFIGLMNERIDEDHNGLTDIHEVEKRIFDETGIYFENPKN